MKIEEKGFYQRQDGNVSLVLEVEDPIRWPSSQLVKFNVYDKKGKTIEYNRFQRFRDFVKNHVARVQPRQKYD